MIDYITEKKAVRVTASDYEKTVNQYLADDWNNLHMAAATPVSPFQQEPEIFLIIRKISVKDNNEESTETE